MDTLIARSFSRVSAANDPDARVRHNLMVGKFELRESLYASSQVRKLWGDYSEARGAIANSRSHEDFDHEPSTEHGEAHDGSTVTNSGAHIVSSTAAGRGSGRALRAFVEAVDLGDAKQAAVLQNLVSVSSPLRLSSLSPFVTVQAYDTSICTAFSKMFLIRECVFRWAIRCYPGSCRAFVSRSYHFGSPSCT